MTPTNSWLRVDCKALSEAGAQVHGKRRDDPWTEGRLERGETGGDEPRVNGESGSVFRTMSGEPWRVVPGKGIENCGIFVVGARQAAR